MSVAPCGPNPVDSPPPPPRNTHFARPMLRLGRLPRDSGGGQDPRGGLRVRLLAGGGPGGAHDPHRSHRRSRPDRSDGSFRVGSTLRRPTFSRAEATGNRSGVVFWGTNQNCIWTPLWLVLKGDQKEVKHRVSPITPIWVKTEA